MVLEAAGYEVVSRVLIVPLWNWNQDEETVKLDPLGNIRFNRTFMELKLQQLGSDSPAAKGFNRTFMELKYTAQRIVLHAVLF